MLESKFHKAILAAAVVALAAGYWMYDGQAASAQQAKRPPRGGGMPMPTEYVADDYTGFKSIFDGTLTEIIDRCITHKIVTLDVEQPPSETTIAGWGYPCERDGPQVRLRIDRERIAETLSRILAGESVLDVTVEDVPLEDVIADLFRAGRDEYALAETASGGQA